MGQEEKTSSPPSFPCGLAFTSLFPWFLGRRVGGQVIASWSLLWVICLLYGNEFLVGEVKVGNWIRFSGVAALHV